MKPLWLVAAVLYAYCFYVGWWMWQQLDLVESVRKSCLLRLPFRMVSSLPVAS